jgi:hypothetical protein
MVISHKGKLLDPMVEEGLFISDYIYCLLFKEWYPLTMERFDHNKCEMLSFLILSVFLVNAQLEDFVYLVYASESEMGIEEPSMERCQVLTAKLLAIRPWVELNKTR